MINAILNDANTKDAAINKKQSIRIKIICLVLLYFEYTTGIKSTAIAELDVSTIDESVDMDAESTNKRMTLSTILVNIFPESACISICGMTAS